MTDSILDTIKLQLGVSPDDTSFDEQIIMHINSTIADLHQLGVGPVEGFEITTKDQTWATYLLGDKRANNIKSYLYMKVRLLFDPPTTQALLTSWQKEIDRYEFRINTYREETQWVDPTIPLVEA
jgi:hypothetical protein